MRCVRLACVKPAASVRSEPGSNSQIERRSSGIPVIADNRWSLSIFRNFESPKSCPTSDPVEDPGFYRAARNRTAEVFASSVAARAPELRRPRFSFLYNQLVKEPESRDNLCIGGGRAPHFIQQLRPSDRSDQLRTLKFRRSFYRFVRFLQNREPPYLNGLATFVKVFFSTSAARSSRLASPPRLDEPI